MLISRYFLHQRKNKITQTKPRERAVRCGLEIIIKIVGVVSNREVKHDVYGRRQTAKITSDFLFFSCNH